MTRGFPARGRGWLVCGFSLLIACPSCGDGTTVTAEVDDGGEDGDEGEAPDGVVDASDELETRRDRGADIDAAVDAPALPPACGDGHLDPGEECDDGNRLDGDECDWECRVGPGGAFEYPDPDPSVAPLEPGGSVVESVPADEDVAGVAGDARSLALAWGSRSYALGYVVDAPQNGLRVRMLDERGAATSAVWSRDVPWTPPRMLLGWAGDAFQLFWSTGDRTPVTRVLLDEEATELSFPTELLVPTREFAYLALQSLACREDRYALLVALCAADWNASFEGCVPRIQAADATGDEPPDVLALEPYDDPDEVPASLVGLADGFAWTDGSRVLLLSSELAITAWSGFLSCMDDCPAKDWVDVVSTGDGLLVFWAQADLASPDDLALWAVRVEDTGVLAGPPRPVVRSLAPRGLSSGCELQAAWGSAGAVVAYSVAYTAVDAEIRVLNTDRWGNPRSGGTVVVSSALDDYDWHNPFAVAADPAGYAVVAVAGHWWAGDERILFRRFVPAP